MRAALLVESHLNRPTKVEGNADHPASLGSTTIFEQASTLSLYDPDRSETVMKEGRISDWSEFTGRFSTEAQSIASRKGEGLAVLTGKHHIPDADQPDDCAGGPVARHEMVCA